jgi:hypothetical protein
MKNYSKKVFLLKPLEIVSLWKPSNPHYTQEKNFQPFMVKWETNRHLIEVFLRNDSIMGVLSEAF